MHMRVRIHRWKRGTDLFPIDTNRFQSDAGCLPEEKIKIGDFWV